MDIFKVRKLVNAIYKNDTQEIERLVTKYPHIVHARLRRGDSLLHIAAGSNHKEALLILINNGADVNARDDKGNTPLMLTSLYDDIVEVLLQHGADPTLTNDLGNSPLDLAEANLLKLGPSMPLEVQKVFKRIIKLMRPQYQPKQQRMK